MNESRYPATLEPVRFGEFLRDRKLIDDEQWLAALAAHWSAPRRQRIGATIVERGYLSAEQVEAEARAFHDEIDVIEIGEAGELGDHGDHGDLREAIPIWEVPTAPVRRVGIR